jgi:hypothetical protein
MHSLYSRDALVRQPEVMLQCNFRLVATGRKAPATYWISTVRTCRRSAVFGR